MKQKTAQQRYSVEAIAAISLSTWTDLSSNVLLYKGDQSPRTPATGRRCEGVAAVMQFHFLHSISLRNYHFDIYLGLVT